MHYKYCPLCGELISRPDWHRCRGIGAVPNLDLDNTIIISGNAVPTPEPEPQAVPHDREDPNDYAQPSHLKHMSEQMKEHERMCVSCSYFKCYGMRTRCVEYRNLQEIQAFWRKRIDEQNTAK